MSATNVQGDGKKNVTWYINAVIAVCIMLFFQYLPHPEIIQPVGWATIGIFVGCIYAWLTTGIVWASLVGLCVYGMVSGVTPVGAYGAMMSNAMVALAFWLMIGVGLLSRSGVAEWIGQWSVTREFTRGKPWRLWWMVMIGMVIVGSVLNLIGALLVFWAIAHSICEEVGYEKGSKTGAMFCFCLVLYGVMASFMLPFQLAVVSNYAFLAAGSGGAYDGTFSYSGYLAFAIIMNIVALIGGYVLFRYILKIDMSKFEAYDPSAHKVDPLRADQKLSIVLFLIMFVLLMAPSFLPAGWAGTVWMNTFGSVGAIMVVVALGLVIRFEGKPFLDFRKAISDNVVWDVLFLFGPAMVFATTINDPTQGVRGFLAQTLGAALSGLHPIVYLVVIMTIALVLTNLINNVVVSAILVPISYTLSVSAGLDPVAVVAVFLLFIDYAILLPSASPAGAMMWSSEGWISRSEIMKFGFTSLAMLFIVSFIIGWPLADFFL